ncbi:hypothetical protein H2202_003978 [Exophiala xenobiotica]|nr:hypothetical protein H2202_003978 [Exophiala xenobiotica]
MSGEDLNAHPNIRKQPAATWYETASSTTTPNVDSPKQSVANAVRRLTIALWTFSSYGQKE